MGGMDGMGAIGAIGAIGAMIWYGWYGMGGGLGLHEKDFDPKPTSISECGTSRAAQSFSIGGMRLGLGSELG